MELTGLSFQNYKAFPERESIEIRPLTVLIGRNSSGKSAIARLPLLLAGAFSERAEGPVELAVDGVDFGASFLDLIHNRSPHGAIGLGATFLREDERYQIWARVQHFSELMLQVVTELKVHAPSAAEYTLTWIGTDPLENPSRYRLECDDLVTPGIHVQFRGLRPSFEPKIADYMSLLFGFNGIFDDIYDALAAIGYLGPFREAPQRVYRFPGGLPQSVGFSGVNAPALLGGDSLRKGGAVVKAVSAWYKEHLGGWPLDVVQRGDVFSLVLRSPDDRSVEVNLADVGTGLSQVLPLIVQRQFETVTGKRGGLEIVEQPELHLHPGAHGSLADLYIEAVKQPGSRFIIETHSENFVLRIRRRIAEGTLDPSLLRLYWVDDEPRPGSRIKTIEVLQSGDVTTWPKGVFSEDFEEWKAIRAAQRKQENEA